MIQSKNDTEDLLLSMPKNCEKLIHQTQAKPQEILEIKLDKSRKIFNFNPPIEVDGSWLVGLVSLEVKNSSFNITEENNKLELFTEMFDVFSFEQ